MRFQVLGPIEVATDEGPLALGGPVQRLVLAHLLVRRGEVVGADVLIDAVWEEQPPASARNTLQSYISRLRSILGADRLEYRPPGYVLHVAKGELDAERFESLLLEARAEDGHPERVSRLLGEAVALWRGDAFADVATTTLAAEATRLEELRAQAIEGRIAADLELGRHGDLVGELEVATRRWPLRERLWGQLMLALYRSGRQGDALAAFARARQLLADELGVDPSAELVALHERVLRQDPSLDVRGEPLRGYRLLEKLGEGAFGEVYRATQPQVGRDVAVKVVRPDLANRPDFVRRFEREAQLVARLEHPHVVPLYDYWREPDAAYLVMRYLRGGNLEDALGDRPLEPRRVATIVDQVASGLSAAHRQGVVHRDVKPANVLLDDEGNAYLGDFGIALDAGSPERVEGATARWTPAYLSPEQIRLEPATPRSDIYALGVVLFEALTGVHPFGDGDARELLDRHLHAPLPSVRDVRPELPPTVDAVIGRATAKDASIRFADAAELAAAFRGALEGAAAPAASQPVRNPFKGLRAFFEADAGDFFGREVLVRRLVERLAEPSANRRFLCVVGPSGSGKSSLVRAGVVPALRRDAVAGSKRWYVVDVMPGAHPMRELERALLAVAVEPPPSLLDDLERDDRGLLDAVDRILPEPDAELLLVVDQLEEAFTLAADDERARFLTALASATAPDSRVRVIVTLRADFYDRPLSVRGFGELLAARSEAITPMSTDDLERAIVGPAERVGLDVEPSLVAAIIADVVDRPGALPLLQFALTEIAERATGSRLTADLYREIGGASGALARRAEQLFETLDEPARDACRQVFLGLVALGEGTEDTRRRVRCSSLPSHDPRSVDAILEGFGRHRLLSFDRDADTREPTVEIAHEALLTAWQRLRSWIDEARDDLRTRHALSTSASEWEASGRDESFLVRGSRLDHLSEWSETTSVDLGPGDAAFLEASMAARAADRQMQHDRERRERALELRSMRRLRSLVAVLAAAALIAATLTVVAVDRGREASKLRDDSTVLALTEGALSGLATDPDRSVMLVLQAVNLSVSNGDVVPSATVEALHWAMQEANISYPVAEGPTAVVAGPEALRGIIDLPLAQVANPALVEDLPDLRTTDCEHFFGSATCPSLPATFSPDLDAEPVRAIVPASTSKPLAGTEVTFFGGYNADDIDRYRAAFEPFTQETGITVRLVGNPLFFQSVDEMVTAGDPPDLALLPQPGAVRDFANAGDLIDMGRYIDLDGLKDEQSPYLASLGTIADDGSWPADQGHLYGAFMRVNVKGIIWYPVPELRRAGYTLPRTWDELVSLGDRINASGGTPWCMGWADPGGASGWPGTDWIENLVLADAGPEAYDAWTVHDLPFSSPQIRDAFGRLGRVLFPEGSIAPGSVETPWFDADRPALHDPPGCWLDLDPSFVTGVLPKHAYPSSTDFFPFPSGEPRTVVGAGDMFGAFSDRPEVREVVRYVLSPEFADSLAPGGGFIFANRNSDLDRYPDFERQQAELLYGALATDSFRFDASDLMPIEVNDAFWAGMMRYAAEGPSSLDDILGDIDDAWTSGST